MSEDNTLCGWRVRSDWPLPELLPWTGDDRPVDIWIRRGKVPDTLPGQKYAGPVLQFDDNGTARLGIRDVAAYLIRQGRDVTIDTRLPDDAPDVGLFLLGTAFGVICHQRGVLPLHASCIAFGDRAFAFAGASGSGKSTIAAALVAQGGLLVADDVTVIDVRAGGEPIVLPGFPRQKLWRDTLETLGIAHGRRLRSTVDMEKYERPLPDRFRSAPIKLAAVRHLYPYSSTSTLVETPLKGTQAFTALHYQIYRRRTASMLQTDLRVFAKVAALTDSTPQYATRMPYGVDQLMHRAVELAGRLTQGEP